MTSEKKTAACENCINEMQAHDTECLLADREKQLGKPALLLHSCCGPCSTACIERLAPDYEITVFFYNPNITDTVEYNRRKENQKRFIREYNDNPQIPYKVSYMEGDYDPEEFIELCGKYSCEPEGGKRCGLCFELRLKKTAETAALLNFDTFTTTLTVSPHKDHKVIFAIGRRLADIYKVGFLEEDFKKKDGFKRSVELAKKHDLYRQDFCGCEFSRAEAEERRNKKETREGKKERKETK